MPNPISAAKTAFRRFIGRQTEISSDAVFAAADNDRINPVIQRIMGDAAPTVTNMTELFNTLGTEIGEELLGELRPAPGQTEVEQFKESI